jgi:CheY-like chemotaxis protein
VSETCPKRILLIDDDALFLYATERTLRTAGLDVVTAQNYIEALNILEEAGEPVDLMLTDVVMDEGVNGFALARMARARRPDLKIMHITGFDIPMEEASGKVLRKPIQDRDLVNEVRAAFA